MTEIIDAYGAYVEYYFWYIILYWNAIHVYLHMLADFFGKSITA